MATTGSATLLLCVVFLCSYQVTQGQTLSDCCLTVSEKLIPKHLVIHYQSQIRSQGCNMDAMIFITRKGRKLCAPIDTAWVSELVKHVDHFTKKCKESSFKGKPCTILKSMLF
ncbi:hypothetical protein UPYG_G00190690 [Umbra pygmaea]|uniref:C-C motif chemokine n=1 Tax=Umbra pygmaea TaxID=75934 RepID=A0ABD0WXD9_UMBPY